MSKNVTIAGASYPAVPSIEVPATGGGTATFTDVSDTTAAASDVAQGTYFYTAEGVRTAGTASGGGGGGDTDPYPVRNDGKTHLWFNITMSGTEVTFACRMDGSPHEAVIDWGDGTNERIGPDIQAMNYYTKTHTYTDSGVYEVTISAVNGVFSLGRSSGSMMSTNTTWGVNGHTSAAERKYLVAVEVPKGGGVVGSTFGGLICLTKATLLSENTTELSLYLARYCYSLAEIVLPPNISSIKSAAFQACSSVEKMMLPASVTSIASNALSYLYSLRELHFKSTTPPTLGGAIAGLPTTCKIYVPTGTLAAYQAATNYPNPATYTYIEE